MIRKMQKEDKEIFLDMTDLFYHSDAVLEPIPYENHVEAFNEIMRSDVYLNGFIIENDNKQVGYAITTKTYSHEAGGIVLWIDELFILEDYRSLGLGKEFFEYLQNNIPDSVVRLRLEVESDNKHAINLYRKLGFEFLNYDQMIVNMQ